jgi:lysophospholipase L1-like esterase
MFPAMENKYYRMRLKPKNSLHRFLQRPCFTRLVVLFFLIIALITILRPGGNCNTGNNVPPGDNLPPASQAANLPAKQAGTPATDAGAGRPAPPPSEKGTYDAVNRAQTPAPPPPTQPVGKGEYAAADPEDQAWVTVPRDPEKNGYDYHKPVPAAGVAVPDDFFKDAVFIGDSRTEGFKLFSGPTEATYYTAKGLKVDTMLTKEVIENNDGKKMTVIEALTQTPFRKVYIMLGINELGWAYSDLFIKRYSETVDEIQNIAPQAQIYIQSLLPVSKERSKNDAIYNNANIEKYNELIQKMAAEKKLYYLNVAQCVADSEGNLAGEASTDGIHLQKAYCDLWLDYLKQHYVLP